MEQALSPPVTVLKTEKTTTNVVSIPCMKTTNICHLRIHGKNQNEVRRNNETVRLLGEKKKKKKK